MSNQITEHTPLNLELINIISILAEFAGIFRNAWGADPSAMQVSKLLFDEIRTACGSSQNFNDAVKPPEGGRYITTLYGVPVTLTDKPWILYALEEIQMVAWHIEGEVHEDVLKLLTGKAGQGTREEQMAVGFDMMLEGLDSTKHPPGHILRMVGPRFLVFTSWDPRAERPLAIPNNFFPEADPRLVRRSLDGLRNRQSSYRQTLSPFRLLAPAQRSPRAVSRLLVLGTEDRAGEPEQPGDNDRAAEAVGVQEQRGDREGHHES